MNYGIPYMGSKSKIAEDLINILPRGNRFVDLFGGGMAMSHCALLSGKYKEVLWNDINPLLQPLLEKAINGDFNYNKFKPEWISKEKFNELKDRDGYIAFIWSFGNNPEKGYLFGKDIENYKRVVHNAIVFNDISKDFLELFPNFENFPSKNIKDRQFFIRDLLKENSLEYLNISKLQQLQRLQGLEQLQRLQELEHLQRLGGIKLSLQTDSYINYIYRKGDIIYCDIPYENTEKYQVGQFNHKEFYDWAISKDYDIYISSYEITDNRFTEIFSIDKRSLLNNTGDNLIKKERLYINKSNYKYEEHSIFNI